jgi:hypothetical protein
VRSDSASPRGSNLSARLSTVSTSSLAPVTMSTFAVIPGSRRWRGLFAAITTV